MLGQQQGQMPPLLTVQTTWFDELRRYRLRGACCGVRAMWESCDADLLKVACSFHPASPFLHKHTHTWLAPSTAPRGPYQPGSELVGKRCLVGILQGCQPVPNKPQPSYTLGQGDPVLHTGSGRSSALKPRQTIVCSAGHQPFI